MQSSSSFNMQIKKKCTTYYSENANIIYNFLQKRRELFEKTSLYLPPKEYNLVTLFDIKIYTTQRRRRRRVRCLNLRHGPRKTFVAREFRSHVRNGAHHTTRHPPPITSFIPTCADNVASAHSPTHTHTLVFPKLSVSCIYREKKRGKKTPNASHGRHSLSHPKYSRTHRLPPISFCFVWFTSYLFAVLRRRYVGI